MNRVLLQNPLVAIRLRRKLGGSRFQEEQGLKVQGSGNLPSGGEAEKADRAAVEPDADAEADPVEAPDVDAEAVRVDVAGADVAGLEQPLSRSEEVQDHRV